MYKLIRYSILIGAILCSAYNSFSQDAILLLKDNSSSYFNPALTAYGDYTKVGLVYRNHLPAVSNGFVTYGASFDKYLENINSGIGITIMRDQPGSKAYNYNNALLSYSYRIQVGENQTVRAGLLGNFYYSVKDPSKLTFPDEMDVDGNHIPNNDYERTKAIGIDIGTGVLYDNKWLTIGAALYHLGNKEELHYHIRKIKLNAHAEVRIPLFSKNTYSNPQTKMQSFLKETYIAPNMFYLQQGSTKLTSIGINLHTKNIRAGIASRQDIKFNSMIVSVRIGFAASFLELDYIIDVGKFGDNLKGLSSTSHEIGIIFRFGDDNNY